MTEPENAAATGRSKARLDQWLWFGRFTKTRSLAARLCTAGGLTINGNPVAKANQTVRIGDLVTVQLGGWQRTVRVLALGARRGPADEARTLYEEAAPASRLSRGEADWFPLLGPVDEPVDDPEDNVEQPPPASGRAGVI